MHLTLNQEAYLLTPGPLLTNNEVIHVKACLHVSFFGLCPLLPPLKFSIVPMVMVWITDKMGDGPIFSPLFWWQIKQTHLIIAVIKGTGKKTLRVKGICPSFSWDQSREDED